MNGQQQAILLRMSQHKDLAKWWRRRELGGTGQMRSDLEKLVIERYLETMEHPETLGNGRIVHVTLYRLAPAYRSSLKIHALLEV